MPTIPAALTTTDTDWHQFTGLSGPMVVTISGTNTFYVGYDSSEPVNNYMAVPATGNNGWTVSVLEAENLWVKSTTASSTVLTAIAYRHNSGVMPNIG